jgi:hypothetical protein
LLLPPLGDGYEANFARTIVIVRRPYMVIA